MTTDSLVPKFGWSTTQKKVNSEETAVEVIMPNGQHVAAKFDLSKLR